MDELSIATAIGKELEPAVSEFAATVTGAPAMRTTGNGGRRLEAAASPRGTIGPARVDNLVRLGLCFYPPEPGPRIGGQRVSDIAGPAQRDRIALTELGRAFVAACQSPTDPSPGSADRPVA
jgi:hypothetical protein